MSKNVYFFLICIASLSNLISINNVLAQGVGGAAQAITEAAERRKLRRETKYLESRNRTGMIITNSGEPRVYDYDGAGHYFSVIDYYKSNNQPAFVSRLYCLGLKVTEDCIYSGKATWYRENGVIAKSGNYGSYGLHGILTEYDLKGEFWRSQIYQNGKLIEKDRFSNDKNSPLIGKWRYVRSTPAIRIDATITMPGRVLEEYFATFDDRSILEISYPDDEYLGKYRESIFYNWKYTVQNSTNGILEQYQGDELLWKGAYKWLNRDSFESTTIFSKDSNSIGSKKVFTRQ